MSTFFIKIQGLKICSTKRRSRTFKGLRETVILISIFLLSLFFKHFQSTCTYIKRKRKNQVGSKMTMVSLDTCFLRVYMVHHHKEENCFCPLCIQLGRLHCLTEKKAQKNGEKWKNKLDIITTSGRYIQLKFTSFD